MARRQSRSRWPKFPVPSALHPWHNHTLTMLKHFFASILCALAIQSSRAADDYKPGADSQPQPGVPKGDVMKFSFDRSKIFPGTARDYYIYVPKLYDPAKAACLMVFQDGNGKNYEAPTVFDNLIHKKELPVIIAVMVMHGKVKA